MNLMAREKKGELSDTILRKQPTDSLVDLGLALLSEETKRHDAAIARANRIMTIAHDLAAERGKHMGLDGI